VTDLLLLPAVGILLLVALDVVRTVLLPSSRGPLSALVYRTAFRLPALAPAGVRRRTRQFAGPAAIGGSIILWLLLVWLGFGLIYWSQIEHLAAQPGSGFRELGFAEALYLSATSLTTLGFGDLSGGTTTLRMPTISRSSSSQRSAVMAGGRAFWSVVTLSRSFRAQVGWTIDREAQGARAGSCRRPPGVRRR
jgi:hypothetical protein